MQPPADPLVTEQLSALFTLLSRAHVIDGPVTRGEYALLALTAKLGPRRACDLADAGALDPSTTSRRVAGLVEQGFLQREPDPDDGRAHRIDLTGTGRDVLARERRRREELVGVALEGWSQPDRRALADLLGRFQTSLARVAGEHHHSVRSVAASTATASDAVHPERTPA